MAERITSLSDRGRGGPRKYPWDEWMDGTSWRIQSGSDFQVAPYSMASLIRKHAQRVGRSARVHTFDDGRIEFQVFDRDSDEAAA